MKQNKLLYKYVFFDFVASLLAWSSLYAFRRVYIEFLDLPFLSLVIPGHDAYLVFTLVPFFWLFLHWLSGFYNKKTLYFKSRLNEFLLTFFISFVGSIVLFFVILIDDPVSFYQIYYSSLCVLFVLQFGFTYLFRSLITNQVVRRIQHKKLGFRTLVVGVGTKAADFKHDLENLHKPIGYDLVGFVSFRNEKIKVEEKDILASFVDFEALLLKYKVEVVVIAVDEMTETEAYKLIHNLAGKGVRIKMVPSSYQIFTGAVRLDTIYGIPLLDLLSVPMPEWQKNFKRLSDCLLSLFAIVLLSPFYLVLSIYIYFGSKGPIFYKQERLGKHNRPFMIYKFRTMYVDAEKGSPMLSSIHDKRIVPSSRLLRKLRLDELPQFYNVLIGDMSLVGPRPERAYYIDQLTKEAPYYCMFSNVRPGLTSWGMVKYGYACNVEEMVVRSKYDLLYFENMSILVDLKILIYTVKTVLTGKGL